ncbi:MAG TPA: ROK family protein [Candidatus Sulfotelmatobacter sp.]|nr:ROK family protein [Candidatus Sulfotelmatobacter sp.]
MKQRTDQEGPVIGVDIGGTKVAAGMVDASGKILTQLRTPMPANDGPEAGLKAVTSAIDSLIAGETANRQVQDQAKVMAIGICAPGPLDPKSGVVLNPPNLPCWRNFPLAARIAELYRVPVKVDNDANAAALAETIWGAARGYHYVFYATVGTGIGTGIVLDGRIYHGHTGSAGEGGHVSIDYRGPICHCGKHGCIEVLAAGPAIGLRGRGRVAAEPARGAALLALAQGKIESVTSEMVGRAYAAGDALAQEILQETADLLTIWLGNIVDLFDPDILVVGGGVAAMLNPFFAEIKRLLPTWCVNPRASEIPLVLARYGADAGIAGGAALFSGLARE